MGDLVCRADGGDSPWDVLLGLVWVVTLPMVVAQRWVGYKLAQVPRDYSCVSHPSIQSEIRVVTTICGTDVCHCTLYT